MTRKIHKDMDASVYQSLGILMNYKKSIFDVISEKRRKVFLHELSNLESISNVRIIKYLVVFCLDVDNVIAKKALSHLKRLIDNLDINSIMYFEKNFRSSYYYYSIDGTIEQKYKKYCTYNLSLTDRFGEDALYIYAILSMHPNGYIREECIIKLRDFKNPLKIKFLFLRANDWVIQVSLASKNAIYDCLYEKNITEVIECIPILNKLDKLYKNDNIELLNSINKYLIKYDNKSVLLKIFNFTTNKEIKRKLYDYLLVLDDNHNFLVSLGMKSKDIVIIRKALVYINNILDKHNWHDVLNQLKNYNNVLSKLTYIEIASHYSNNYNSLISNYIFDKSYVVRDYARYQLRQIGIKNFRDLYFEKLEDDGVNLPNIIKAISEVGVKDDVKLIKKYLCHAKPKVRKTALNTICYLDVDLASNYLYEKLLSSNKSESNNAKKRIVKLKHIISQLEIESVFESGKYSRHIVENLISIVCKYSKWQALKFLMLSLDKLDETYVDYINNEICLWISRFNCSFNSPKENDLFIIKRYYLRISEKLNIDNRLALENIIKYAIV